MSESRGHYVYRAISADGELLYVGRTKNLERRWSEHKMGAYPFPAMTARVKLSGPYTYDTACRLEREALATEDPLYGFTPRRHTAHRTITRMQGARAKELMAAGMYWVAAAKNAASEIPALPIHNRFGLVALEEAS